jgi:tRNA dimethylallyltransferase
MARSASRQDAAVLPLAAIVGPTGSGKTELAMAVAGRMPIEVIVADLRQLNRGMEIGTAQPGAAERAAVPHHLVDAIRPDQPYTVSDWVTEARRLIPQIAARCRLPVVVGGSGLLVSALLDGYTFDGTPSAVVREELTQELAAAGIGALATRLRDADPAAAARIDLRNPRRVTRALERSLGADGGAAPAPSATGWPGPVAIVGLRRPREVLYRRIDVRASWLFANGLLEEVRELVGAGLDPDQPPMTSHGYAEAAHLLAGEWSLDEAIAVTGRRTRQYAKRQLTWFGRDRRIAWLDAGDRPGDDPSLVDEAVRRFEELRT